MSKPVDCTLFPYNPGCDHMVVLHADDFSRLEKAIRAGGGFRLLVCEYNIPGYRDLLMDRLRIVCDGSRVLHADREKMTNFPELQARLAELALTAPAIHLTGLENWPVNPENEWLPALNYQREKLSGQCPIPLVLWLSSRLVRLMAIHASDVWAWRAGVFDFLVTSEAVIPPHIRTDAEFLAAPERERRRKRIAELNDYMAATNDLPTPLRASLLMEKGDLHKSLGEPDEAMVCYEQSLSGFQSVHDKANEAEAKGRIADIYQARGELDEALRIRREEALPVYERLGDVRERAVTLGKIADIWQARGELDEALRIRREEELPVYERLGDVRSRAVTLGQIADIYQARGELDEALRIRREEAIPVYERLGDVRSRAVTLGQIADIYQARGALDEALRIRREEALPVYERLGDVRSRAVTLGKIADIYEARGALDEALRIRREEELPVYERLGDVRSSLITRAQIAMVCLTLTPPHREEARRLLSQALTDARRMKIPEAETIVAIMEENGMNPDGG